MNDPLDEKPKIARKSTKQSGRRPLWRFFLKWSLILGCLGIISVASIIVWAIFYYGRDLPDYRQLAVYEPSVVTRVHAGDGSLLTEYSRQPRLFVPINAVPEKLIQAFLSAEDKDFYNHNGLDYMGMVRGNIRNIRNVIQGLPLQGGSTISQQVARTFLLTLDQKLDRKIKEMILTLRIERAYTKDHILELYLNEINFGNRSYGVAAAALNYFNKALNELTVAEMAFLAALPKAPHRYHPARYKERALERRNWVLGRMYALDHIDEATYEAALQEDIVMRPRSGHAEFRASYYAEEVRRQVQGMYGTNTLYEGGLSVRTPLEPRLQAIAETTLRAGLVDYDRRHGWRGALKNIPVDSKWLEKLKELPVQLGLESWQKAIVHEVRKDGAIIGVETGGFGFIPFEEVKWARSWRTGERLGSPVRDMAEVLSLGDVIAVEKLSAAPEVNLPAFVSFSGEKGGNVPQYGLRQVPAVEGAIVALNPHTGRILAMVGGFDYNASQYNRATQAKRQPGSSFKPFVYAVALDNGFTPASLVLDAPFVLDQGEGQGKWKPKNSSDKFYGPSTLRLGIEKSRNLMTVRLAQHLGMPAIIQSSKKFGLTDNMEPTLAASLGAGEVTLMQLSAAYGMIVNGGKKITPSLIDRIQDRRGKTIFRHETRDCIVCTHTTLGPEPIIPDTREDVLNPQTAYQLVSMMQGVVENGTGRKIASLGKILAGKTGTTNDSMDAWFVGFSADMVVGVFVGFDRPRSLGPNEEGSSVAVPIFRDFMRDALKGEPDIPFRMPPGIRLVRVNRETGQPVRNGDSKIIMEAFKPGTEPRPGQTAVLDGSSEVVTTGTTIRDGSGGIY